MSNTKSTTTSDAPAAPLPNPETGRGWRTISAFFLGVIFFVLLFNLAEAFGVVAAYIGMAGACFISQFLLSRGHPRAIRTDWPIILAMNSVWVVLGVLALLLEPNRGAALEGAAVAPIGLAGCYAGAALAARTARTRLSSIPA